VAVVPPLDQQRTAPVVDDDPGDTHGVRAISVHVPRSPRIARLSHRSNKTQLLV
jgi:hypothetical protein